MTDPAAKYPLLDRIHSPRDLKRLRIAELPKLAAELRDFLIQNVSYSLSGREGNGARPSFCLMVCRSPRRPVSTLCG